MVQCGHCSLLIGPDDDFDEDYNFYLHHQRAHSDCPDWPALEQARFLSLPRGQGRIRIGDSPPMRILLQN